MSDSLKPHQRAFLTLWNPTFGLLVGWRQDDFNAAIVRNVGIGGLMRFGKAIGEVVGHLGKRYGESTAQLLVGFAGMWNGCGFCGIGHVMTANLLFFDEKGTLFPISEDEVADIQRLTDDEIVQLLEDRLTGTSFEAQMRLLLRMDALRRGAPGTGGDHLGHENESDDDLYLRSALEMWSWTNECSIEVGLEAKKDEVPIFARLTRKSEVYTRYREARRAATSENQSP